MIKISLSALNHAAQQRPEGYMEDVMSCAVRITDSHVEMTGATYDRLQKKYSPEAFAIRLQKVLNPRGPGTELSKLLKRFGIEPTPTCKCRTKSAQMDAWGPDECEKPERVEEVLAVMRDEAKARGLPFVDVAGRLLIHRAIRNARQAAAR